MKQKEIEFKYDASDIKLTDFIEFCKSRDPQKYVEASGYDYFYESPSDIDGFYRLRVGHDIFQLTYKRKTTAANNFIRDEDNLDMQRSATAKEQIEAHIRRHGYVYNTSLFKNCFVFNYDLYTLVYYICYDADMKEVGRFVEIEMSEEHSWPSEKEAYSNLLLLEKLCKSIGLIPQARIKNSLFERYRKAPK